MYGLENARNLDDIELDLQSNDKVKVRQAVASAVMLKEELITAIVNGDHSEDLIKTLARVQELVSATQSDWRAIDLYVDIMKLPNLKRLMIDAIRSVRPGLQTDVQYGPGSVAASLLYDYNNAMPLRLLEPDHATYARVCKDMRAILMDALENSLLREVPDGELLYARAQYMDKHGMPSLYEDDPAVRALWPDVNWLEPDDWPYTDE